MSIGEADFLPGIDTETRADQIEYLLRLARGRAYLESSAPEQAKGNLRDAEAFFNLIADEWALGLPSRNDTQLAPERMNLACGQDDSLEPFIINTEMNLHYHLARTYDALCDDDATVIAAREEWRLVRNGRPTSSRQEAWRDDAVTRLSSGMTCADAYGLAGAPTPTATPDSEPTPVG